MKNSKEYYLNQKRKSVNYWEKRRKNRFLFAFKQAIIDALIYGVLLNIIVNGIPTVNNFYKLSITFSIVLFLTLAVHYFFSFKFKEKYYQKVKKELDL